MLNLLTNNPFILTSEQLPYFYESEIRTNISSFTLSEATSKHCIQVLRMQPYDLLQLTDGNGLLVTAQITLAHKKHSQVSIQDVDVKERADRQIAIAVAPTKSIHRIEWLLEKLTEIGTTEIFLITSQRTERTVVKQDRLQQILISAMLQSRQVFLPRLSGLIKFSTLVNNNQQYTHKWIAHCLESGNKNELKKAMSGESHLVLIGPEGDFTPEEVELALKNQFDPVTLGTTRLRTETAGLVASVLLSI